MNRDEFFTKYLFCEYDIVAHYSFKHSVIDENIVDRIFCVKNIDFETETVDVIDIFSGEEFFHVSASKLEKCYDLVPGDAVIVHAPSGKHAVHAWSSKNMKFVGKEAMIKHVHFNESFVKLEGTDDYQWFLVALLEPAEAGIVIDTKLVDNFLCE